MKLTKEEVQQLIAQYESELRQLAYRSDSVKSIIKDLEQSVTKAPATTSRSSKAKTAKAAKPATAKRRGRPPKAKTEDAAPAAPKRRGRPPKAKKEAEAAPAPKRRGRPPKAKTETKPAPKRRGRPPKAKADKPAAAKSKAKATKAKSKAPKRTGGYRLSEWDNLVLETLAKRQKIAVFSDFLEAAVESQKGKKDKLSEQDLYRRINQSLHKLANKREMLVKVSHSGRGYAYGLAEWKRGRGVQSKYK
ncbi:MAG: hypothetical protein R3301_04550 [Saprospiraceae bacterium]|nr:hypothetical protein [Saprospiraceae bacterium]